MIPPEFDYLRPHSVDEAVTELGRAGDDAKVLAGGQSLLPLLRLRLAYPTALVDLGGVGELRGIRQDGDQLVIGAMTTHHEVVHDPLVVTHCPLLSQATATVADPAVRHRGTFGGALAHADPAGDLPAVALALDAEFVIAGPGGERRHVPAAEFFSDYLETAVRPGEVLVEIRVPVLGPDWGSAYEKFNRVAQAWAIVGVAAAGPAGGRHHRRGAGRPDQHGADPAAGGGRRAGAGRGLGEQRRHRAGGRAGRRRHGADRRPVRAAGLPAAPGPGADPPGGDPGRERRTLTEPSAE